MQPGYESSIQWSYSLQNNTFAELKHDIISEKSIALKVNGVHWLNFICSPFDLEALAIGFLYNQQILSNIKQIKSFHLTDDLEEMEINLSSNPQRPEQWHRTTTGIALNMPVPQVNKKNGFMINAKELIKLYKQFTSSQVLHKAVGGFHSSALSDGKSLNITVEDVGRHNTLDKLTGLYLLQGSPFSPYIFLVSGRVSSEMIHKSLQLGVSIIVTRTTPTYNAVLVSQEHQITLIGYMRQDRFTIYSHPERISLN